MKRTSLGGGDVKLLFMVGLFLGLAGSLLNLLVACAMGLVFALVQGLSAPSSSAEGGKHPDKSDPVWAGHRRGNDVYVAGGADYSHVVCGVVLTGTQRLKGNAPHG